MKGLVGYLAGFLVGLPTPLWGQVVLSEVMFDPAGSEFYDEFVEVQNVGDQAVDLTGWRVGDGEETHRIVPVRGSSLMSPGAFGLILDSGYFDHSSLYHPLPDGVLILTVDSPTLGRAGLDNLHSERVVLIAASGDTVATMGYRPGNLPGISKEKINPEAGDGADNWADSRWIGGTPGRINSVSPKVDDLVLEQISNTPLMLPFGQDQAFALFVANVGKRVAKDFDVQVLQNGWVWKGADLAPADSVVVAVPIRSGSAGRFAYEAVLHFEADQDTTNNRVIWDVVLGASPGAVVVNEVMFFPESDGVEWVELLNRSERELNLVGWQVQDNRPASAAVFAMGSVVLSPGAFVVVTQDEDGFRHRFPDVGAPVLRSERWPRLNDNGDAVVVKDGTGTVVDSMVYHRRGNRGQSWERIDPIRSSLDDENWLGSTDVRGASPGVRNSVAAPEDTSQVRLVVSPNPFREQVEITYTLPLARAQVNLWVFDRLGRQVRVLLEGEVGGGKRRVIWDGLDAGGRTLKPGIYIVHLEAGASNGRVLQARASVVLAKGLD